MGMSKRGFDIHIERIALTAMPPGGERRLREAVARVLAQQLATADRQTASLPQRIAAGVRHAVGQETRR